jgi:hypothetical protein
LPITLPLAVPSESTFSRAPLFSTVPLAIPPAEMMSTPPLLTCVPLASPPNTHAVRRRR